MISNDLICNELNIFIQGMMVHWFKLCWSTFIAQFPGKYAHERMELIQRKNPRHLLLYFTLVNILEKNVFDKVIAEIYWESILADIGFRAISIYDRIMTHLSFQRYTWCQYGLMFWIFNEFQYRVSVQELHRSIVGKIWLKKNWILTLPWSR